MTDEEVIRATYDAFNQDGIDSLLDFLAPDVVWHAPPDYPEGEEWHGREAFRAAWREQFEVVFSDMRLELVELERGPRAYFVAATATGHAIGSNMDLDFPVFYASTVESQLITEVWVFFDRAAARRQAGLEPHEK